MEYRTAIVTGASRGLGLAVARQLAARGLDVVAASRTEPPGLDAQWVEADLATREGARRVAEEAERRLGAVDVLVNNAAVGSGCDFAELAEDEIEDTVAVNLLGVLRLTRAVLPGMLERGRGLIVNVGSDLGRRHQPGMAVYAATKWALVGFSSSLRQEVTERGVKVCAVLPGVIDTSFGGFAPEGSRPVEHGMPAEHAAAEIVRLLDLPPHLVVDEIQFHPVAQRY